MAVLLTGTTIAGNVALHAGNVSTYALPIGGGTLTGQLNLHAASYEGSIVFGSNSVWRTGIRQHDDGDAELRIWAKNANGMIFIATGYDGEPASISRPTDGLAIQGNKLGIGDFSTGDPSYKLHVKGDIYANGGWLRVSGSEGLYFESHGGGWRMIDSTWIRAYNDKNIYTAGTIQAARFEDANDSGYYLDPASSSNLNGITARQYYQALHGEPRNNLGDPTITDMALFDAQFNNKTEGYPASKVRFFTSSDGTNFTEYTGFNDVQKQRLLSGDDNSGVYIPNLTNRFRVELDARGYVFVSMMYLYWSSNSHSTKIHIWIRRCDNQQWYQHTSSNTDVSSWPGHVTLPFGSVAWLENNTTSSGHFDKIRIEFIPTWSGHPTYGGNAISLDRLQLWGGYPAGKRNLYYTNYLLEATFPSNVYSSSGKLATESYVTSQGYITSSGSISGNAATATTLATARTLTIGATGKTFNGSADVSWTLAEIGAQAAGSYAAASHTHGASSITSGTFGAGHYIFPYQSGITGASAPSYTQGSIEIYTDSNHVPAIGFHRGGYSATTLYEYDGQLYVNAWVARAQTGLLLSTGNIGSYAAAVSHTHDDRYYTESESDAKYSLIGHEHDRTFLTDSRGAARLPSYYDDRYAQWDFQNTADTGAGGDTWHGLLTVAKWTAYDSSHRQEQLAFTGNDLKRRTASSDSAWGGWKTILDSDNYNSYSPTLTGTGASGTWGINVTGSSASTTGNAATATALQNGRTLTVGATGKTFDGTANVAWSLAEIGAQAAGSYVIANGTSAGDIDADWGQSFKTFDPIPSGTPPIASPNIRTINVGENFARRTQLAFNYATDQAWFRRRHDSTWGSWREFIHSGNIGSQSVSYATTAGALTSMNISQFTNNSGYITGYTETNTFLGDGGNADTHPGTSRLIFTGQVSAGADVLGMPATDNSNAFLNINRHSGEYNSQLGFSSNGSMYYRSFSAAAINSTQAWRQVWDSGNLTNLNQLTNGPGYITGYTETDTLATVTARGNTTNGSINVHGNILLTGPVTTTNQGRMIDFTGFDKEGTTDFSDRAYIQHTINAGGHAGSVLVISSENDTDDGIAFLTNASSKLKHNSNNIATETWVTSQGYITSSGSISGNAATATIASTVTVNSGNTSAAWYPIVWHSGNTVYSSSGVEIYANGNYIRCQYINTTDNDESGITRFVIKNGDSYHRSATTTVAADIIRGVASGTWSINVTGSAGSATTATTANRLERYGVIYGNNWNDYYLNNRLIAASAHNATGTNKPDTAYNYGSTLSYYNSGEDHYQIYVTENSVNSNGKDRKMYYRSGWNGSWGGWRSVVDVYNSVCYIDAAVTATGDITAYSDARIKENVNTLESALDKTLSLRGVSYNRTDIEDKSTKIGFIAQELLEVVPEVVTEDESGMYGVSYGNITALLVEAIKEQQKQIEELKLEIQKLKSI